MVAKSTDCSDFLKFADLFHVRREVIPKLHYSIEEMVQGNIKSSVGCLKLMVVASGSNICSRGSRFVQ